LLAAAGLHLLVLGVVGAAEGQPEGNAVHLELLCQVAEEEALVVRLEEGAGVEEKNKKRRPDSRLDEIVYFEGPFVVLGQVLQFLEIVQPVVEQSRRYSGVPFVIAPQHSVKHLRHSSSQFGTHKDKGVSV
jgi:hypothetical protein